MDYEMKLPADMLPMKINTKILDILNLKENKNVLMITLATKPCFYKLWSIMKEAEKQDVPYIILNTGQHYDDVLGHGTMEFGFDDKIAVNLQLRGNLSQKSAELFLKMKNLSEFFKKNYSSLNFVPFVNGDTVSAGILPAAWMFATNMRSFQGESGLRGMSPNNFMNLKEDDVIRDPSEFMEKQFNNKWILNRSEPFPEQYDTYVSAAGSEYMFAPVELNKEHLIREGYSENNIFVTGNTVVDAIRLKKEQKNNKSVFDLYPKLENGEWLRVDIHRRGNLIESRFKSIIGSVIDLVESEENVCFIELTATKKALEYYGLRDRLIELSKEKNNFLFTPVWMEYGHVIEFLESDHCWSILTDSGSMQEEMNELQKPCFTARFNTDRPETVMDAHSNLLVPPLTKKIISTILKEARRNDIIKEMASARKLYGENAGAKTIRHIKKMFEGENEMFSWAHDLLNIRTSGNGIEYL